jgi:alkanesulfonate monooxygenase SsuD/methylene tetrahydromethanopterin reductase-like flavin-dependent oxidoreductase (luciferase family)
VKYWFFSEQQYHPAWNQFEGPACITPPSSLVDPEVAADLFDRYYAEFRLADELGFNIAVNEHHSSVSCMSVSPLMTLAALARQTSRARLLSIGTQMVNRVDPIRIAEEIAMVDLLSRGRLDAGLIKGTQVEVFASNQSPMRMSQRFWEAHDLVIKALTSRGGSFRWDSDNYHYRHVNVIPPCYQRPHPPIWMVGGSPDSSREIARHGYVMTVFGMGTAPTRVCFDAYRAEYLARFGRPPDDDRFAYHTLTVVAPTTAEAARRGEALYEFYRAVYRKSPVHNSPPGYAPTAATVKLLRSGNANLTEKMGGPPPYQECIDTRKFVVGTPDQVAQRFADIYSELGGCEHMLAQSGGLLTFDETKEHLHLLADEVKPRVEKLLSERHGARPAPSANRAVA